MKHHERKTQRHRSGAWRWMGFGIVVTIINATGCAPDPNRAAHTVEYFRAHTEERQAAVRECANNPGELGEEPRCVNALEAERLESIGSLRKLPPLRLPAGSKPGEQKAAETPPLRDR